MLASNAWNNQEIIFRSYIVPGALLHLALGLAQRSSFLNIQSLI